MRILNTQVSFHSSFWFFYGIMVLFLAITESLAAGISAAIMISIMFFCILLHEFGHVLVGRKLGLQMNKIALTAIGGVASIEDEEALTPKQEFLMTIAGPTITAILAGLFYVVAELADDRSVKDLLCIFGHWNLVVLAFNSVPAFPMDGGRILRSTLAFFMDYLKATKIAVWISFASCCGLIAYGIYTGKYMMAVIAVFVALGGVGELLSVGKQSKVATDG